MKCIKIDDTKIILKKLGMDEERYNDRSCMVFLALAKLDNNSNWKSATNDMLGTRAIMDWIAEKFDVEYKPNSRETIRRFTLHQFVQGGIVEENHDNPSRPINSPKWNYRLTEETLNVIQNYKTNNFDRFVIEFNKLHDKWIDEYKKTRSEFEYTVFDNNNIKLSSGGQNILIKSIIEKFCPRFAKNCNLVYVDDTNKNNGIIDKHIFDDININLLKHGKAPDLILYNKKMKWVYIIEACSSGGPIDVTRINEFNQMLNKCPYQKIFISCFPTRKVMQKYFSLLAWETEAWCADSPDHLIHLDGEKYFSPYQ